MVNSAALFRQAPTRNTPAAMADRLWALSARAPLLVSRELVKRWGRALTGIVNMVDVGAPSTRGSRGAYGMTSGDALVAGHSGLLPDVQVNGITPKILQCSTHEHEPRDPRNLATAHSRNSAGSSDDIVNAVAGFAVTGRIVAVDGGRTLGAVPVTAVSDDRPNPLKIHGDASVLK